MSALSERIAAVYREESGRVMARLIRVLGGDFQLAEEGLHDAFEAALTQWPEVARLTRVDDRDLVTFAHQFEGRPALVTARRFDHDQITVPDVH